MKLNYRISLLIAVLLPQLSLLAQVKPGIEVLRDSGFEILKGKRVGLVTNPSGIDRNLISTIDILNDNVDLVALYAPEHGVRGNVWAGAKVDESKDASTGIRVHSLYGATRQPTKEMLDGIDIIVYDIQDVGTRSYTFISTLGLVMRSCAELGIPVVVLDRPNPLGGVKMEGVVVRDGFHSFVSQYKIPYIYGLTVGEVATLINEEGLNRGQKGDKAPLKCKLTVVPMEGWERSMTYQDTGLPWVMPSPNIPYPRSAMCYPCSGLVGEFHHYLNIGIGYTIPFDAFAAEWIDADKLKARLDKFNIPGVEWRTIHYTPFYGSSSGKLIHGVQFYFTDYEKAPMVRLQFYVMQAVYELYGKNPFEISTERVAMFDKVNGTDEVRKIFSRSFKESDIDEMMTSGIAEFRAMASKYYLY